MKTEAKRYKIAAFALGGLLFISILFNALQYERAKTVPKSILGTFLTDNPLAGTGEYIVFAQDNTYMVYRQLEPPLERGSYEPSHEQLGKSVFTLRPNGGTPTEILYFTDSIYLYGENTFAIYRCIADIPMYSNIHDFIGQK